MELSRTRERMKAVTEEAENARSLNRRVNASAVRLLESTQRLLSMVGAHLDGADATYTMRMNGADHQGFRDHVRVRVDDGPADICAAIDLVDRRTQKLTDRASGVLASSIGNDCAMQ